MREVATMSTFVRLMGMLTIMALVGGGYAVAQQTGDIQVYMPLEELARKAQVIARGTVLTVKGTPPGAAPQPFQFVTVAVKQVIKGTGFRAGAEVTLRTDGTHISTFVPFQAREDVVLFLQRVSGEKAVIYELTGGIQGKYTVTNGRVGYEQITVEEFIRRIRRAL